MYRRLSLRRVLLVLAATTAILLLTFHFRKSTSNVQVVDGGHGQDSIHAKAQANLPPPSNKKAPVLEAPGVPEARLPVTLSRSPTTSSRSQIGAPGRNVGCLAKERHITLFKPLPPYKTYDHSDIVHYVKLVYGDGGGVTFNFREYLAVLSAYKFYKPKRILIHTNGVMRGDYWDKLQQLDKTHTKIEPNRIPRPTAVGGKSVIWIQHSADYVKVTKVQEYGGIMSDMDVIIVNGTKLRELQSISECVLSHEGPANIINAGFFSCAKGSSFMKKWVETYHKDYRPSLWVHNAAFAPAAILLDKSTCYNVYSDGTVCQDPKWGNAEWWLHPGKVDWKSKVASHYWFNKILTTRNIPSDESVLRINIPLADMFKYVVDA